MRNFVDIYKEIIQKIRSTGQFMSDKEEFDYLIVKLPSDYQVTILEYKLIPDQNKSVELFFQMLIDRFDKINFSNNMNGNRRDFDGFQNDDYGDNFSRNNGRNFSRRNNYNSSGSNDYDNQVYDGNSRNCNDRDNLHDSDYGDDRDGDSRSWSGQYSNRN